MNNNTYSLFLNDHIDAITPEQLQGMMASLPLWRRQQALRFRHHQGQVQCTVSFLLLAQGLLQQYGITDIPPFIYNAHGKPSLDGQPNIHFNISHCRQAVAVAISSQPIGIDIESIGRYKPQLAQHVMNDNELQQIAQATDPALAFTRLWTQKEAYLKLTGEGITRDLRTVLTPEVLQQHPFHTQTNTEHHYVLTIAQ